jgi:hypothetical protein
MTVEEIKKRLAYLRPGEYQPGTRGALGSETRVP